MATKAGRKKSAPLRKAQRWGKEIPGMIGKMALILVAVVVLGLMFSGLQGIASGWLRTGIAAVIAAVMLMLFYNEGLGKGGQDANTSVNMAKLEKAGKSITEKEDAACYHPLKALCAAAILFAVPLLIAVIVAVNSKAYTYTLQDLPTWLTSSYGGRGDVMGPLSAYTSAEGTSILEWLRVIVRLMTMVFINFFEDAQRMSQLIDRCVPAFIALYPLSYIAGYLRGPAANAKLLAQNKKAKKAAVRKQKKSNLTAELLGETQVPHYGHKRDSEKPRKKELI